MMGLRIGLGLGARNGGGAAAPTLAALTGTFSMIESAAPGTVAGALGAKTSGSTLSLVDDAGGRVALSGSNVVAGLTALDYETTTSHSFTVRETLTGATNTPRDTILTLTVTNDAADDYVVNSVRGADTKASAGAVNMGSLLSSPITATSSVFTPVSGTSSHWNLPVNGTHPTPNSTGVSARLNGGPYVFTYTLQGGTISGTLTITRDLGRSLAAYDYIALAGGRTDVIAENFTTACYTVSTTAEYSAISAANKNGATILLARGGDVSALIDLNTFNHTPTNACLIQSEDITKPTNVGRVVVNQGGKHRFDNFRIQSTKAGATALYGNANILRTTGNCSDVRFSNMLVGAPIGTAKNDYPAIALEQATDLHVRNQQWYRYSAASIRYQTRPVFRVIRNYGFNLDAFFFGNASNEVWTDGVFEDIIGWEPHRIPADGNHPDAGQLFTTATAAQGIAFTGTMIQADVRFYGGAGDLSFNGFFYTGSGSGFPKLQGTIKQFGAAHSSLTSYAAGHLGNADYSASVATEIYAQTAVRQLSGVTGSITLGKESGAQGFDTWDDAGAVSVPSNNQRFPGHKQSFAWPTGCNLKVIDSYFDGEAPTTVGTMDISASTYKGKTPSSTDPVGLPLASVNDNSAFFDDPLRSETWVGLTGDQIDAIHADMLAAKAGAARDKGNGRVEGRWCVRRAGAVAKVNQYGRATLSVASVAGTTTVTLSAKLAVAVICDIFVNGVASGVAITIPAGSLSANAAVAATAGATVLAKNDSGLLNPSATAS